MKNDKNRVRRKLNNSKSIHNRDEYIDNQYTDRYEPVDEYDDDYYYDESDDYIEKEYYEEYKPIKVKRKKSFLARLAILINVIFAIFTFVFGVFYIRTRIIVLAALFIITLLYSFTSSKRRKGLFKFILKLFVLINIVGVIIFIPYFLMTSLTLNKLDHENIGRPKNSSAYNIMLLGFDTEGEISRVSRSDVNILLSVNLKNQNMHTTTIPRDTYLPIAEGGDNQYDKLTHAGIYGSLASMKTIENALDTPVDYYVRINFTSFMSIVDALGGINVNNSQAFTSNVNGKYYEEGDIYLNGEDALAFVRQRYGLADGDIDRGRNQVKAINAILKKIASPMTLVRYPKILDAVEKSIETNVPANQLFNIAVEYLISGGMNSTESIIQGEARRGLPSHAMPGYDLFMYVPYESSLEENSRTINDLLK